MVRSRNNSSARSVSSASCSSSCSPINSKHLALLGLLNLATSAVLRGPALDALSDVNKNPSMTSIASSTGSISALSGNNFIDATSEDKPEISTYTPDSSLCCKSMDVVHLNAALKPGKEFEDEGVTIKPRYSIPYDLLPSDQKGNLLDASVTNATGAVYMSPNYILNALRNTTILNSLNDSTPLKHLLRGLRTRKVFGEEGQQNWKLVCYNPKCVKTEFTGNQIENEASLKKQYEDLIGKFGAHAKCNADLYYNQLIGNNENEKAGIPNTPDNRITRTVTRRITDFTHVRTIQRGITPKGQRLPHYSIELWKKRIFPSCIRPCKFPSCKDSWDAMAYAFVSLFSLLALAGLCVCKALCCKVTRCERRTHRRRPCCTCEKPDFKRIFGTTRMINNLPPGHDGQIGEELVAASVHDQAVF